MAESPVYDKNSCSNSTTSLDADLQEIMADSASTRSANDIILVRKIHLAEYHKVADMLACRFGR